MTTIYLADYTWTIYVNIKDSDVLSALSHFFGNEKLDLEINITATNDLKIILSIEPDTTQFW